MEYTFVNSLIVMGTVLVPLATYLILSGEWRRF